MATWVKTKPAFASCARTFDVLVNPLVEEFGGKVISGVRSIEKNREVGGVQYSLHLIRCAKDVQFPTEEQKLGFADMCVNAGLEVVVKNTVVHVELDIKSVLRRMVDDASSTN